MKYFQDLDKISTLTLIKLEEKYKKNKLNEFNLNRKKEYIFQLKEYALKSYEFFTTYQFEESTEDITNKLIAIENNNYQPSSIQEIIHLRETQWSNEKSKTSYRDFTRAINLIINFSNQTLLSIAKNSTNSINKHEAIEEIDRLTNETTKLIEQFCQTQPVSNFKTDIIFEKTINNLQHFKIICKSKRTHLQNIHSLEKELLNDDEENEKELEKRNEKAIVISKILDNGSKTTTEILSSLFEDQIKNISPDIVKKEYDELSTKHFLFSEDIIAKYCHIRLRYKIISNVAPKEIVIEASTFMEGFLYEYIFKPMKMYLQQNLTDYFKQVGLKFTDLRSLTMGFYLAWFRNDSNKIKFICFKNNSNLIDSAFLRLIDEISVLNETRNLLVHNQKNNYEGSNEISTKSLHELSSKSISCVDEIIKIFQNYGKINNY